MSTNTPIATQTLSSAASSVTFSSIPQGYTDLIIVGNLGAATTSYVGARFNSDTGSNYSVTNLSGNGTTAISNRASSRSIADLSFEVTNSSAIQANFITQIMNYSNSTTFKTVLTRTNNAGTGTSATVVLWRSTSAITSIELYTNTGNGANLYNFTAGSTFSIYGIQAGNKDQKATGGNIVTSDGTYIYHAFTSSGSFIPNEALTADVLVVAGGGGNGVDGAGGGSGGAGAGGLFAFTSQSLTVKTYPVVVGAGGTNAGTNGNNSIFGSLTTVIGGGTGGQTNGNGSNGGSGGGGGNWNGVGSPVLSGGSPTSSQGYAGGTGATISNSPTGGGGGAGAVGGNGAAGAIAGSGGVGATSALINQIGSATKIGELSSGNYYLAGGGGGSMYNVGTPGTGGLGGGAAGVRYASISAGNNALPNTGGGAGGSGSTTGANGGSGVIIIRYLA